MRSVGLGRFDSTREKRKHTQAEQLPGRQSTGTFGASFQISTLFYAEASAPRLG